MVGRSLVFYLTLLSLVGSGLVACKLVGTGLHRRYRLFFAYFLFRIYMIATGLPLDVRSDAYFYHWIFMEPIICAFYVLVVGELYQLVLEKYEGLRSLGRYSMYAAVAISAVVSILSLLPKLTPATPQQTKWLFYVAGMDRGITLSLAIFLLLMLLFLSRYPVPLGRNVIVHAVLFTVFFVSSTLSMLLKGLFGKQLYSALDTGLMATAAGCMFAWFALLSPKGEEVMVSITHFTPEQEERILHKLDALNATMLKAGGK